MDEPGAPEMDVPNSIETSGNVEFKPFKPCAYPVPATSQQLAWTPSPSLSAALLSTAAFLGG